MILSVIKSISIFYKFHGQITDRTYQYQRRSDWSADHGFKDRCHRHMVTLHWLWILKIFFFRHPFFSFSSSYLIPTLTFFLLKVPTQYTVTLWIRNLRMVFVRTTSFWVYAYVTSWTSRCRPNPSTILIFSKLLFPKLYIKSSWSRVDINIIQFWLSTF